MAVLRPRLSWRISERIRGVLAETDSEVAIEPGLLLICGEKSYPILRIFERAGKMLRFEVLADQEPAGECRIVRPKPVRGKLWLEVDLDDWVIASLRMMGFDFAESSEEADVVIGCCEANPRKLRVIVPKGNLRDFTLDGTKYDIRFPRGGKEIKVNLPSLGAEVYIPSGFIAYPIRTGGGSHILGVFEDGTPAIVYLPKHNVLFLASEAILIAYDELMGKGENSRAALWLLTLRPDTFATAEGEIGPLTLPRTIRTSLSDEEAFRVAIEALIHAGGSLTFKDDALKRARVSLDTGRICGTVEIRVNKGLVEVMTESEETVGYVEGLVARKLRETEREKERRRRLRVVISTAFEIIEGLITVSDAIEAGIGTEVILEEVQRLARISKEVGFEDVAKTIEVIGLALGKGDLDKARKLVEAAKAELRSAVLREI